MRIDWLAFCCCCCSNAKSAIADGPIACVLSLVVCFVLVVLYREPFGCFGVCMFIVIARLCCYSGLRCSCAFRIDRFVFRKQLLCELWTRRIREYVYWELRIMHNYPMRCMFPSFLNMFFILFYIHSHPIVGMR